MKAAEVVALARLMRGTWPSYQGWPWSEDVWSVWLEELADTPLPYVEAAVKQISRERPSDFPPGLAQVRAASAAMVTAARRDVAQCDHVAATLEDRYQSGQGYPYQWSEPPTLDMVESAKGHARMARMKARLDA